MIDCEGYYQILLRHGFRFFTGVPDSLLKDFCAVVDENANSQSHIIASNEGAAIALAAGHYLASENPALVYMQNSGLGNAVNPLTSLADSSVYSIPMLLMIGWRGEPGYSDELQHLKQGQITCPMLVTLGIPYEILPINLLDATACIEKAKFFMEKNASPYALVVRKDTFSRYLKKNPPSDHYIMSREQAVAAILAEIPNDAIVVVSTGMISREVFEVREQASHLHQDFLTVGSMGHANQIALGVAEAKPNRQVYCIDGDGAFIMHMGSVATIGARAPKNFKHIILNNEAHDSVGGQPTAATAVDLVQVSLACRYQWAKSTACAADLPDLMKQIKTQQGPAFLDVKVRKGHRAGLGRPTVSPLQNKYEFMKFLR